METPMSELSAGAKRVMLEARAALEPSESQVESLRTAIAARIGVAGAAGAGHAAATSAGNGASGAVGATGAVPAAAGGAAAGAAPAGIVGWFAAHAVGTGLLVAALGAGAAGTAVYHRAQAPHAVVAVNTPPVAVAPPVAAVIAAPVLPAAPSPEAAPEAPPPQRSSVSLESLPLAPEVIAPAPRVARHGSRGMAPRSVAPSEPASAADPSDTRTQADADAAADKSRESLAEEVQLLRAARADLDRGNTAGALVLLREHQTRFPNGTLREERLALKAQALCASGQRDAARAIANEIARTTPASPHLAGLRACIDGR
jgi:hypothetical protein